MSETLTRLWDTIIDRQAHAPAGSYTASLFAAGLPRIAQKVGEEGIETVIAALSEPDEHLLYEMADLVYHCMVLLAARGLTWNAVEAELAQRFK